MLYKSGRARGRALALLEQAAAQAPEWPMARVHFAQALAELAAAG